MKLLAIAERDADDGSIGVRVHPAMVPDHPPAGQRARELQRRVRRGRGRRQPHVLRPGRRRLARRPAPCSATSSTPPPTCARAPTPALGSLAKAAIRPIDDARSEYYLNLEVADRPGVLAAVAGAFGDHGVSIRAMEQEGLGDEARLVFITHTATERDVQATLHDLRELDAVTRVVSMLRVVELTRREVRLDPRRGAGARLRRRPARGPRPRRRPLRARARCPPLGPTRRPRTLRRASPPRSSAPYVERLPRPRRPRRRRLRRSSTHPDVVPARRPRRRRAGCRSCSTARRSRSRTSPSSSSAGSWTPSCAAGASGARSSWPRPATPARPPSRRASAATSPRHRRAPPRRPGQRRAAPADDDGRRAQRAQRRRRGHLRRLPGPGEGALRRRTRSATRCASAP